MTLKPLTDAKGIAEALAILESRLRDGSQPLVRIVRHRDRSAIYTVHWRPPDGIWSTIDRNRPGRYWCVFGTEDPTPLAKLSITCEINPPKVGSDPRYQGVFLRDDTGGVHIAHRGKLGGGRVGNTREGFLRHLSARNWQMHRLLGDLSDVALIARLDDDQLPSRIAAFVQEANRFKQSLAP